MFSTNLKYLRNKSGMDQLTLANKLGRKSVSSVSEWEKGKYTPKVGVLADIAHIFNVSLEDLMNTDLRKENSQNKVDIFPIFNELTDEHKYEVYDYAQSKLDEQNHPNVHNIEESKQNYTIDVLGAVSAGTGEWLDGQSKETVTIEGPIPKYDFAVRVNGNSMEPTFSDGEILFVNKVDEARNNQFVIAEVNGEAFVKKLFVSMDGVKLISLNRDYDDIVIHDYDDYQIVGVVVL
ncbi:S24 family peptidase [Ligilactobacillus pobuzihii]|nr:S24 family peptidase [Ligilactobacillus pobuzihii]GEN48906.1 repressor [Ligilactobacillus pobuzihii]